MSGETAGWAGLAAGELAAYGDEMCVYMYHSGLWNNTSVNAVSQ